MSKNKNIKTNADKLKEEFYKGMAELRELIDKLTAKTDAQIAKTDAQIAKTSAEIEKVNKEIEKVNKMVGDLTGGWGKFVEGMVEPSFKKLFEELGIKIMELYPCVKAHYNGETMELDIISVAKINKRENIVILVEAESSLTSGTVIQLEEKINNFFKFFQTYKGLKIIGVVAGIRIGKGVDKFAERKGFYILGPSGDTMIILNKPNFKPKIWK